MVIIQFKGPDYKDGEPNSKVGKPYQEEGDLNSECTDTVSLDEQRERKLYGEIQKVRKSLLVKRSVLLGYSEALYVGHPTQNETYRRALQYIKDRVRFECNGVTFAQANRLYDGANKAIKSIEEVSELLREEPIVNHEIHLIRLQNLKGLLEEVSRLDKEAAKWLDIASTQIYKNNNK